MVGCALVADGVLLYRRILEAIGYHDEDSPLFNYDPFRTDKMNGLKSGATAAASLAKKVRISEKVERERGGAPTFYHGGALGQQNGFVDLARVWVVRRRSKPSETKR